MPEYLFPPDFLWGSSTSAFQIEGDCQNHDFYRWAIKGHIKDGSNPNDAVHHYRHYIEDVQLLQEMNHNAARIGVEWARIEPQEGFFDEAALAHYRDELMRMKALGLKSMVTLHHFTTPLWLADQNGWFNPQINDYFCRYVQKTVAFLGDLVDFWLTINEPNTYAAESYFRGIFPPGEKCFWKALKIGKIMSRVHCQAYATIQQVYQKENWPLPQIGWSLAWIYFLPASGSMLDRLAKQLIEKLFVGTYLKKVQNHLDFIGMQYYRSDLVKFPLINTPHPAGEKSKLGWDIMPDKFYLALTECWQKYQIPIIVTENGVCDDHDELRPAYLVKHLYHLWRAIQDKVLVKGYLHWSTLDNFELAEGLSCRFGLVHVDHESPERTRTIKPSGRLYGEIIKQNGFSQELLERY